MNITTLVFFAVMAFFVWRGYEKGLIGALTPILSWLIAYPAAIFFTKPLANVIYNNTSLKGVIVYLIAGCGIFVVVSLLVTLLLSGISRLIPDTDFTARGSKLGGATVGILFGGVLGLLAVYLIDMVRKPGTPVEMASVEAETQSLENGPPAPQQHSTIASTTNNDTFIETTAKKLVSNAASTAVDVVLDDKTTSQITKSFTRDPQTMLNHVQQLNNDGELKRLLENDEVQSKLNAGDVQGLLQDENFKELMNNPDMHAILQTGDENQQSESERAAAEKMVAAWQKVDTLKNDQRVKDIVNDTAFQQQLNSPNKIPLLMNPKLRELTEIIFSSETTPTQQTASQAGSIELHTNYPVEDITDQPAAARPTEKQASKKEKKEESEQKIYRWTDESGKVHYTDKPVKDKN